MKVLACTLFFCLIATANAIAQVTLVPPYIFTNNRMRFGSYRVINESETPKEVSISFRFSYTASDSSGQQKIVEHDPVKAAKFSIVPWVRAFPKKFILPPKKAQTVRFRVGAPDSLKNGMYWARIITASQRLENQNTATQKGTHVKLKFRQISGLYYKVGDAHPGIKIKDMNVAVDANRKLNLTAKIDRTGNALFIGSISINIYDRNNKRVTQKRYATHIYFDSIVKRTVDVSNLPAGVYTAKLRFETQRNDVPKELIPQMSPVTATTPFIIE